MIHDLNPQVGFYPSGMKMAMMVPVGPSAPTSSDPRRDKGLFYSGMAPLTQVDFVGPAHSRAFVPGLGRRLPCPPVVDILGSLSEEDLTRGLEVVTIQV